MDSKKKKALEAAGWKLGEAADFLGMTDIERQLLDARVAFALAIRRQRAAANLSQQQLAARIKTSQSRVAKIEQAAADVSLDQLVKAFAAAGGKTVVKSLTRISQRKTVGTARFRAKKAGKPPAARVCLEFVTTDAQ